MVRGSVGGCKLEQGGEGNSFGQGDRGEGTAEGHEYEKSSAKAEEKGKPKKSEGEIVHD